MTAAGSDALVLFGVTGDLAYKIIFPPLYAMTKRGALIVPVIGVALPKWSVIIAADGGWHNPRGRKEALGS